MSTLIVIGTYRCRYGVTVGFLFPGDIQMTAQLQAGPSGQQLRPDLSWRFGEAAKAKDTFAILEMKIPGGIEPKDLDRAKRRKENATNAFDDLNLLPRSTRSADPGTHARALPRAGFALANDSWPDTHR